ncbi:MAG TPA: EAL domain-containing protein [Thermoanaerobaculia bacterium]|nr:EAL domain-containing protein [Thermoanaerobaculia bacterium]
MSDEKLPDFETSLRTPWTTAAIESPSAIEWKLTEQRLQSEQLRLLGTAVHVAADGIAILTPAVEALGPRIAFVNDGFCSLYGRSREEIIGETPVIFGIVDRHVAILDSLLQHVFDRQPFHAEASARRKDGSELDIELELVPVEDGGQLTHWVAFLRDVSASKQQLHMLRHQAMHDTLTDLPNRAMLFDRLDRSLEDAKRTQTVLALLLMDLDRFKDVNDTFGHHFGDVLLRQVAFRLGNAVRPEDTVARLGGDEFAIVIPDAVGESHVAAAARRVLNTLEQPFLVEGQVLEVGASIGIALYPSHGGDARTLLRRADVAMYAAKQASSGYSFHQGELEPRSPDQLSLVVEMRHAIERNEFVLFYQPKLHLRSGLVTRVEVLLRWEHRTRGLLAPAEFVPLAERTNLIKPISDWLLDRALQQCHEWQERGAPVHVAVNLSAKSLQDQLLPSKILRLLEKWDVDPRFLKIEITESSIMADPAHALAILSLLQSIGIRLSIDDFGTGYSSLTHLRELPIDEIKIDQSFVKTMTTSEADAAIVRTVIDLAHNLGKQVCAEGVEDEATWMMLRDLGCDLAQGYWIAHPMSAPDLIHWLFQSCWGLRVSRP